MAFKKAEQAEDYYIIRVNELFGKDIKGIQLSLPGKISDAYEVKRDRTEDWWCGFTGGKLILTFHITQYESFAVKIQSPANPLSNPHRLPLTSRSVLPARVTCNWSAVFFIIRILIELLIKNRQAPVLQQWRDNYIVYLLDVGSHSKI